MSAPEQKQHPSIFIDGSNEVAWGDTPKAVKTGWWQIGFEDASRPGSLDFSGH
ncbi:hypothetical protein SynTAK9802_02252 [Synechococcus sp. TAK9802]|nr:hypothetical protein SynTAK9802_02252 [Synechococcus sp. TAK9802]